MVGFNNVGFDYPVLHFIYQNRNIMNINSIYDKAMSIIDNYDDKFSHIIWDNDQIVPQVDLFKIHHFDNMSRATSLKVLEFNMRSTSIQDLPYKPGTELTLDQITELIKYNRHDVLETLKFYNITEKQIKFREELSTKYNKNFINYNDTKIGKEYFIMRLEEHRPGSCYKKVDGKRKIVQTHRESIKLKDIILPYVKFENNEFNRILNFFKNKEIVETKGAFKNINCTVNDFKFDFGTGGIHGSVDNKIINSDDDYIIEDWDVASYYPNLAISNGFYPAHLGKEFCSIYEDVYQQRKSYAKGTAENAMLKLALNGVYGDSNNQYSPFFDPQYTMSITINGQLLLCMLAEMLMTPSNNHLLFNISSLGLGLTTVKLIQINTDGLTIKYPRIMQPIIHSITKEWEDLTKLTLESAEYNRMFIRDVNNYIAEYKDGSVKRKGAYEYKMDWHQNHSALVVPMAAEAYLLKGTDIAIFINNHEDVMDFMLRTKVRRSDILEWGGKEIQRVTRYYVSTDGEFLEKRSPPTGEPGTYKRKNKLPDSYYYKILKEVGNERDDRIHTKNKSIHEERTTGINTGWTVQTCNNISDSTFTDINYDYYIQETKKLVEGLK